MGAAQKFRDVELENCEAKKSFTREAAVRASRRARNQRFKPYKCNVCARWHLTTVERGAMFRRWP